MVNFIKKNERLNFVNLSLGVGMGGMVEQF